MECICFNRQLDLDGCQCKSILVSNKSSAILIKMYLNPFDATTDVFLHVRLEPVRNRDRVASPAHRAALPVKIYTACSSSSLSLFYHQKVDPFWCVAAHHSPTTAEAKKKKKKKKKEKES